jgi:hypothetical protein
MFILLVEIAGMTIFGWLGVRGLLGLQSQHWLGTGVAIIAALGLGFIIPRQLPFMVGEITGHYTLQIALDSAVLRVRLPFSVVVRRICLSHPTDIDGLRFLPGMTIIMLQSEDRLCFGSTLPRDEQLRLQGLIRAALLPVSTPQASEQPPQPDSL